MARTGGGAIFEAGHDESGIIWQEPAAPLFACLICAKSNDPEVVKIADDIDEQRCNMGCADLYDDRNERAGVKFADMDLTSLPWQSVVGAKANNETHSRI